MPLPETATFAEFADLAKRKRSWVTQLRKDDRLVLDADGKRVLVAESLARIEATKDPSKIGVAARHAATRAAASAPAAAGAAPAPDPTPVGEGGPVAGPGADEADDAPSSKDSSGFQHWRERSERAKALQAERENAVAEGKLMAADEVLDAIKSHYATLRAGLEALPDFLALQLVGLKDENRVRALIADAIEQKLAELARQFGAIAKEAA